MIIIDVNGIEDLYSLREYLSAENLGPKTINIIVEELGEFAKFIKNDQNIPREYVDSLTSVIIANSNQVVFLAYQQKKWDRKREYKAFKTKMEYMIYTCPKRKYFGGEIAPEYNGPDFLVEKWKQYSNTFINNVKTKIVYMLGG